ncbi:MAG: hypothetical protein APR55_05755 [Methanolinea sp. SDB]|nr:MAG: hypothetical protein APR55_05755 [Methanolinea sp. SDB]
MTKTIRTIISGVIEGAIKRFSGAGRPGETIDGREYFQHYGFTSRPRSGAEGVCLKQGNVVFMIASDDRRYRVQVEEGEVCLYDDQGQAIHLKRGKTVHVYGCDHVTVDASEDVQVNTKQVAVTASESAQISAPAVTILTDALNIQTLGGGGHVATMMGNFTITGSLAVDGPISATGNITSDGSIVDTAGNTNHHSH